VGKYQFGASSQARLSELHPHLIHILSKALDKSIIDFTVIEGHRTVERQNELYRMGKSKIDGYTRKGKHNYSPSLAVDIAPYPIDWTDVNRFYFLGGVIKATAKELGYDLRWGYDWDGDGDFKDQTFNDGPHFELKGAQYE
jgi:peptidoglycan L-alanyl-D-glutamate endopeptidase CwlK|tara:strand:- start:3452 stop:3874 length:423 start_codon:yes stop_codon:yes gene_type:complete